MTLLANVLLVVLQESSQMAQAQILRYCSMINFSKDCFRQQSQYCRELYFSFSLPEQYWVRTF
jgi:hypothetical protein